MDQQQQQEQQEDDTKEEVHPLDRIRPVLICDGGYGLPTEARPRRERLFAVARQLVNFIQWQTQQQQQQQQHKQQQQPQPELVEESGGELSMNKSHDCIEPALIKMIGWHDPKNQLGLRERIQQLLQQQQQQQEGSSALLSMSRKITFTTPENGPIVVPDCPVDFSDETIQDYCCCTIRDADDNRNNSVIYLSPDAEQSLDPGQDPPRIVVVGMLVDRRIRPHQSRNRAERLDIPAFRLPLDNIGIIEHISDNMKQNDDDDDNNDRDKHAAANDINNHDDDDDNVRRSELNVHEPLNIDTVLELMQRWWWNCDKAHQETGREMNEAIYKDCFFRALQGSLGHHQQRHPERTLHMPI